MGGKELETLLARLSLQAASSAAVCLFQIRFTDIGLMVLGVAKADDLPEHFPVPSDLVHAPISEIQAHQWTNWSDQPKIVVGLQLAIGCGYFVVAGRRVVGT